MLNYKRNYSNNTLHTNPNGLDVLVADVSPIRFNSTICERNESFPVFYACGFFESHNAFEHQVGAGCNPDVVVFRTKEQADAYVLGKVISVRQYVAQDVETIDLLVERFGLKS